MTLHLPLPPFLQHSPSPEPRINSQKGTYSSLSPTTQGHVEQGGKYGGGDLASWIHILSVPWDGCRERWFHPSLVEFRLLTNNRPDPIFVALVVLYSIYGQTQ